MPAPRGYTQVVETTGPGRTVYLSGQLGMTPDGMFAGGPGDFRAQATQCFENLKAGLASVGGKFEHVVKITNFFVDMTHLPAFFAVRDRYVNTKAPPASTAIQVARLARDGALFEIEAVAVISDRAAKAAGARRVGVKLGKPAKKAARKKRQ
jgi:enamine deaminase RidA (YjgF/YER057c/UK114 family)